MLELKVCRNDGRHHQCDHVDGHGMLSHLNSCHQWSIHMFLNGERFCTHTKAYTICIKEVEKKYGEKNTIICSSYTIDKLWLLAINRIRSWQSTFHLIHAHLRRSLMHSSSRTFSKRASFLCVAISFFFHLLLVYCISFCLANYWHAMYARFYEVPCLRLCITWKTHILDSLIYLRFSHSHSITRQIFARQ